MDGTGSQILQAILIVVLIVFLYSVVRYISAVLIVMYQNVNKDGMSVGGHWIQQGEYSHTGATLPTYDLSGYYQSVPTPPDA